MIRNADGDRWRGPQRFMDAAEIYVGDPELVSSFVGCLGLPVDLVG
jgi:hypothetical protein